MEARWARHRAAAERLWAGLERLGLQPLVDDVACRVPSLTTVKIPVSFVEFEYLVYGFSIHLLLAIKLGGN